VVVLGSSALISDSALTQLGDYSQYNAIFVNYAMGWLIDASKNRLYIESKTLPTYTLNAGNATSFLLVQILVVVLIPVGLLVAAFFVFRRRRHL
jgi:ABC-type transport system involved in multi-copper enzyme maturation permease subunit